jgi:3-deoxy-D-arabino-heptulosonate 7-phosphate (DAHP) synthase
VAVGSDGIMVEVHDHPERALSDGPQAMFPEQFAELVKDIRALAPLVSRAF